VNGLSANSVLANNAEPSLARKALTAGVLAVVLLAAVVIQLTVVNRLPLPGGAVPDLVLLLVTATAVCTSPLAGALAGFAAGLALDVAPPAVHYAGEYALVFCLAGWGAARVDHAIRDTRGERDPMITFAVMAGAAAAGEAGQAALGMMLSDPDVTGAVASRVLPTAILYDLLAAPFVFWLVARITRGADAERAPAPEFSVEQRLAQVFRSAAAGAAPRLRLAGTGENYHKPPTDRAPRLRLSDGRAGSSTSTYGAAPGAAVRLAGGRTPKLSFGGDLPAHAGQARTGPRAARALGKNWLRGAASAAHVESSTYRAAVRRSRRGPGRGWLTGGSLAGPSVKRTSRGPGKGWITAGSLARQDGQLAVRGPGSGWISAGSLAEPSGRRVSRGPGKGWITAAGADGLAGPDGSMWRARRAARGPGRGWLRAVRPGGGPGDALAAAGKNGPRSAADALAARSAPSGLSALAGAGTPMAARAPRLAPRRGWLSGTGRPSGAVLGGHGPAGGSRGRRALRASAFRGTRGHRGNWYAAAPSRAWLRRSRHPWRKRSQRLLRLMGVGK
jgi:rod shape-determining protein MreD